MPLLNKKAFVWIIGASPFPVSIPSHDTGRVRSHAFARHCDVDEIRLIVTRNTLHTALEGCC